MYKDNIPFIEVYRDCLSAYRDKDLQRAEELNQECKKLIPLFLQNQQWYFDNFKSRLFTKDKKRYFIFYRYGTSNCNFYFINNNWVKYEVKTNN